MPWPTSVTVCREPDPRTTVVSGVGSVREQLGAQLVEHAVRRPFLFGQLLVGEDGSDGSPATELVRETLGDVWEPAAGAGDADALVAVGDAGTMRAAQLMHRDLDGPAVPLLWVSTTLAVAEGLRSPGQEARPMTTFLDGEVAISTADSVWCETGVQALDGALASYLGSAGSEPFLDPLLESAASALGTLLPRSRGTDAVAERQHLLTAAWMAAAPQPRLAGGSRGAWFATAARRALAAVLDVPERIGSCVAVLPGLRFHAAEDAERQLTLKRSLSWSDSVTYASLHEAVRALLDRLEVPRRLRDIGVGDDRLDDVVRAMLDDAPQLGPPERLRAACASMC